MILLCSVPLNVQNVLPLSLCGSGILMDGGGLVKVGKMHHYHWDLHVDRRNIDIRCYVSYVSLRTVC